jgi:hypothetical protein
MSLCSACTALKPVSICNTNLIIGTVANASQNYNIYFRSLSNGFLIKYTATSSVAGLLTLSPADGFVLATNHTYEMYVNQTQSTSTGVNLTIGSTVATCYNVIFEQVYDMSDVYSYINQTLEIAV